jgi:hypothetical protein
MNYWLLPFLLLAVGCQSSDPPSALQEAVVAHIRQHSARPASYQPLGWGPVRKWRQVDDDSLVILQARDYEDSVKARWLRAYAGRSRRPYTSHYADSTLHLLDSLRNNGIRLNNIAAKYDTTRRGTQVAHIYQLRTATGRLVRDSAQFLVPRRGLVVRLPRLRPLF